MRKKPLKLRKVAIKLEAAGTLCAEVMALFRGRNPVSAFGWRDYRGNLRRVQADYDDGWRLRFGITENGCATRITARLHLKVKP